MEPARRSYIIKELLGAGGFGEVYRATMIGTGGLQTEVAVKMLRDPREDSVRRMKEEARLLAKLRHPAILRLLDLTMLDGRVSLITEFVEGVDLSTLGGHLPLRALLDVLGSTADALHSAWSVPGNDDQPLHLVHRDVKPSNIRVGRHGEAKLLDFGIAWTAGDEREAHTRTNAMVGSLAYMAPERFSDEPVDHASDVYALGCVLYEGLTGEMLASATSAMQAARLASQPDRYAAWLDERLQRVPADVPDPVRALMRQMLAWTPSERPTAKQVSARCDEAADLVTGPRLKQWARDWPWGEGPGEPGPLSGRTIDDVPDSFERVTESSIAPPPPSVTATMDLPRRPLTPAKAGPVAPVVEAPAPPPPEVATHDSLVPTEVAPEPTPPVAAPAATGSWRGPLTGGAVVLVGLLAVAWWARPDPTATPTGPAPEPVVTAPAPPPEPAPASQPLPVPGPAAEQPAAAPVGAPRPKPRPATPTPGPAPTPAPAAPAPAPEPTPAPTEAAPTGSYTGPGNVPLELRGAAGTFPPGPLPPGRYAIWADFGPGFKDVGSVRVESGAELKVSCNTVQWTCEAF